MTQLPRADSPTSDANLCAECRHAETVRSARGSTFTLCRLSVRDARFARYPRLPVVACEGFARRDETPLDQTGR
jgi:hypothetical protein